MKPCRLLLIVTPLVAAAAYAAEHPRLLLDRAGLAHARWAAGLETDGATDGLGRRGAHTVEWLALRQAFLSPPPGSAPLPGELLGVAAVRMLDPNAPGDRQRVHWLIERLTEPAWLTSDPLEYIIALDWCWDAIPREVRSALITQARQHVEPLELRDSPYLGRRLRPKLLGLALVAAVDDADQLDPAWRAQRARLREAAEEYVAEALPNLVALRGLAPTSPAAAADEIRDTALLIELCGAAVGRNLWPQYRASVGRWLEHYALVAAAQPGMAWQLPHDIGTGGPLNPTPDFKALRPVTAHLIAARTQDPAAVATARLLPPRLRSADSLLATNWLWTPLVFPLSHLPQLDRSALPPARDWGNAIWMTSGEAPATSVWIETGRAHLDRRQAFDAGGFTVRRDAFVTAGNADNIALVAIPPQNGAQHLASSGQAFDFEQYAASPIAHNCLVVESPTETVRWYDKPLLPAGGQRMHEGPCLDWATPPARHQRRGGDTLAYSYQPGAAYAALDLTSAYRSNLLKTGTREFFFVGGRALVVVDRFRTSGPAVVATNVVQLPARPGLGDDALSTAPQTAGHQAHAGVWHIEQLRPVTWQSGDSHASLHVVWPEDANLRIVGGPAEAKTVAAGPHAGRRYVGGGANTFERVVIPAHYPTQPNAWYVLGAPRELDPLVGRVPVWGRAEISYARTSAPQLAVYALFVGDDAGATVETATAGDTLTVRLSATGLVGELKLPLAGGLGGDVVLEQPTPLAWTVPHVVVADGPLATSSDN